MAIEVNYLAILVSAIASMVIGSVWYGWLFREKWMSLMGYNKENMGKMKMTRNKAYAIQFVASLVMAYILSHSLIFASAYLDASGWMAGVSAGFWNWLGYIAPVTLGMVLWENRTWSLWFIVASSHLVTLIVMGVILSLWV